MNTVNSVPGARYWYALSVYLVVSFRVSLLLCLCFVYMCVCVCIRVHSQCVIVSALALYMYVCVCLSPSIGTPDEEREDREAFPARVAEDDDPWVTPQRAQPEFGQGILPLLNARTHSIVSCSTGRKTTAASFEASANHAPACSMRRAAAQTGTPGEGRRAYLPPPTGTPV